MTHRLLLTFLYQNTSCWRLPAPKSRCIAQKAGYSYPTIRLPHTLSKLAGLSTRIYQTIYDGSLAFLTVLSPTEKASKTPKSSALTWRRSCVRITPGPSDFLTFLAEKDACKASFDAGQSSPTLGGGRVLDTFACKTAKI